MAFFHDALGLGVDIVAATPKGVIMKLGKSVGDERLTSFGNVAFSPMRHAEPIAELCLAKSERQIGGIAGLQADAADGFSAFAQADGVGFRRGENGTDDLAAFFDALMRIPAGDGADSGILGVTIKRVGIRFLPGAQDQTIGGDHERLLSLSSRHFNPYPRTAARMKSAKYAARYVPNPHAGANSPALSVRCAGRFCQKNAAAPPAQMSARNARQKRAGR